MYLIPRRFYLAALDGFGGEYPVHKRSGDTYMQGLCAASGFSIAATRPSFLQHIGLDSSAWPTKVWRYSPQFRLPVACRGRL